MRKRTSQGTDGHSQSLLLRPVVQIRANPSMSEDSTLDLVTLPPDMDGNHQIWGELTYIKTLPMFKPRSLYTSYIHLESPMTLLNVPFQETDVFERKHSFLHMSRNVPFLFVPCQILLRQCPETFFGVQKASLSVRDGRVRVKIHSYLFLSPHL